jgi:hypothetical protein
MLLLNARSIMIAGGVTAGTKALKPDFNVR